MKFFWICALSFIFTGQIFAETLGGSLIKKPSIRDNNIRITGNLRYYGNEKNLALESINGMTPGIASIGLYKVGGDRLPNGMFIPDKRPIIIYSLIIDINYDNNKTDEIEMRFPITSNNRALYVKRMDGTYGYPKGHILAYGRGLDSTYGRFKSKPNEEKNIYYIKAECQKAIDCTATLNYRVLQEGEYYTPKILWEQRGSVQTIRDTVIIKTPTADLNNDGVINFQDFLLFVEAFDS